MLIQKTTPIERKKNSATLDQLLFSFFDANITGVKNALSEEGIFLGRSKLQFLSKLNTIFSYVKAEGIDAVSVHLGISVDVLPGCEMFEVRYIISPDLLDENGMNHSQPNDPVREGEVVIRFAFKFLDGKIVEIRRTRSFIAMQSKDSMKGYLNN